MGDTFINLGLTAAAGAALAIGWYTGAPVGRFLGDKVESVLEGLKFPTLRMRAEPEADPAVA